MNQKSDLLDKQISKLRIELEELQAAHDGAFSLVDEGFRDKIFQLNGIPELDKDGNHCRDLAEDVLSKFFYEDALDVDSCLKEFYRQLGVIQKEID
ncbi:hypothetical protein [Paenibacillus agricola]|nr:hypothetical protein [Paenibacillus agricola]